MLFKAEVSGRLTAERSCQGLLYAPLQAPLTYRATHYYEFDYTGAVSRLAAFVRKVLLDEVSQTLHVEGHSPFEGYRFCLQYGMKPGVLDLEKEAILAYYRRSDNRDFSIERLHSYKRLYIFGKGGEEASPEPFVRDIVNPAIHVWKIITNARTCA